MVELKIEIPESMAKIAGEELKEAQPLFREAIEQKLKVLLLFKVVDDILKKSKLSDDEFSKLVEEYRDNLAKRYGISS